ncbi:MAG: segregation/condensation protein A [Lachnospiraceae bacterium]|nr:segregation/condensation protein A [Lachnospiraceae bacterium]
MEVTLKLEAFEGPLDLLLHLIEKNKVDIYDIPIAEITDQYMAYLHEAENRDMNIMSEFLVMAATLIDIKCRMLLPKDEENKEEEGDPRDELVAKLLEYKMYKYMSYELKDRFVDAGRSVYKEPTLPREVSEYRQPLDYKDLMEDLNLKKLNDIFNGIMKRAQDRIDPIRSRFGNITKDEISMDSKFNEIITYLNEHEYCSFTELLTKQSSKLEIIVTFLVVLELMKTGMVTIRQDGLFDDIFIQKSPDTGEIQLEEGFAIV